MQNAEIEILLIEDNSSDAELAIYTLKKHHLTNKIVHLKDGIEAFDYIHATLSDKKFRIILLDLNMPEMGGLELIKKLKSGAATKNIVIVVMTASDYIDEIKESVRLAGGLHVRKPLEFADMEKIFSEIGLSLSMKKTINNTNPI